MHDARCTMHEADDNIAIPNPTHASTVAIKVPRLMRREGVYSSSLSTRRRQRQAAALTAMAPQ
jgi:hypothetical protein